MIENLLPQPTDDWRRLIDQYDEAQLLEICGADSTEVDLWRSGESEPSRTHRILLALAERQVAEDHVTGWSWYHDAPDDYATRVSRLRTRYLGCTQREFGRALGVASITVSRWERGAHTPSPTHWMAIRALADAYERTQCNA